MQALSVVIITYNEENNIARGIESVKDVADEILVAHGQDPVALVGIYSRGAIWAERVYDVLKEKHPHLELGKLDISLYRDDLDTLRKIPMIRTSEIPDPIDGTTIILFDDVFYTGRTIRAAMEVLGDYGRPAKVELVCEENTGTILGAAAVSESNAAQFIDAAAVAVQMGMDIQELGWFDAAYAPPFAPVWNALISAALKASRT